MKTYQIAETVIVGDSLPACFSAFQIEKQKTADCVVKTSTTVLSGTKKVIHRYCHDTFIVHQLQSGEWVYTIPEETDSVQLLASQDYRNLRYFVPETLKISVAEEQLTNLLRVALQCLMVQKGMLFLHAACIEYDGRAVAFSGDSGVGKSTRAASWVAALSAQWISGDRPLLCHKKNEYYACGLPWDGKEQIIRSVEVSLLTILQVHRAGFQRLRRMTPEQARNLLMSQCFIPMWDTQTAIKAMETIRYMSEQIHFCHVFCGADEESAKELWQLLYSKPMKVMEEKEMLKIKKGFKISKVAGEYMAIPVGEMVKEFDGTVILNEVSAFIFRHLADGISREDLQDLILEEFEVSADRAGKDLDKLLAKFREYHMMECEE